MSAPRTPILPRHRFVSGRSAYFVTPPGWDALLLEFDARLAVVSPGARYKEIRHQFGVLKVKVEYVSREQTVVDEVNQMVRSVEADSGRTCEVCGNAGSLRGQDRQTPLRTRCEEHITV